MHHWLREMDASGTSQRIVPFRCHDAYSLSVRVTHTHARKHTHMGGEFNSNSGQWTFMMIESIYEI